MYRETLESRKELKKAKSSLNLMTAAINVLMRHGLLNEWSAESNLLEQQEAEAAQEEGLRG